MANRVLVHSVNARGLMSGILQQGYSFGYVMAACANLGVGGEVNTWKTVFWIGSKAQSPPDLGKYIC
jgi:hypothetical protein